ncbi:hypothetical protein BD560DRAFT_412875 [Blakeslea trispora]|nr:hypothetical protein BD560DRAFT_412875 [Blakeslea trispora]
MSFLWSPKNRIAQIYDLTLNYWMSIVLSKQRKVKGLLLKGNKIGFRLRVIVNYLVFLMVLRL